MSVGLTAESFNPRLIIYYQNIFFCKFTGVFWFLSFESTSVLKNFLALSDVLCNYFLKLRHSFNRRAYIRKKSDF